MERNWARLRLLFSISLMAISAVWTLESKAGNAEARVTEVLSNPSAIQELRRATYTRKRGLSCENFRYQSVVRWLMNSPYTALGTFERIEFENQFLNYKLETENEEDDEEESTAEALTEAAMSPIRLDAAEEIYGAPLTVRYLYELANFTNSQLGVPLTVTAVTTGPIRTRDSHRTHHSGFAFDLRPLPGTAPTRWTLWRNKSRYDREMNRQLILRLVSDPDNRVKRVVFNDPALLKDREIRAVVEARELTDRPVTFESLPKHNDHIHVELYPGFEIESIASMLLENLKSAPCYGPAIRRTAQNQPNSSKSLR